MATWTNIGCMDMVAIMVRQVSWVMLSINETSKFAVADFVLALCRSCPPHPSSCSASSCCSGRARVAVLMSEAIQLAVDALKSGSHYAVHLQNLFLDAFYFALDVPELKCFLLLCTST